MSTSGTVALLTPPSSLRRRGDGETEIKFVAVGRSVAWVDDDEIHSLSTPVKKQTVPSKQRPAATRSILKKVEQNGFLAVPTDTKQRQVTPEPADILLNQDYLTRPVSQIIAVNDPNGPESLEQLIEGYNVLAVRLRSGVAETTDADASWPLFQPLRKNIEVFVDAVVRDLGRALVDPLPPSSIVEESVTKCLLPSPEKSPVKKKGGMTGEQVKYARDLCTTCHSVIKALAVILSLPALYSLFEENHLRRIFTNILAIPLAEELPTPNARKTCALAIWLIQVQRLPAPVLQPAASRIAYALRRGIEGELGKEGKKGSANDGLKAICDLCEHLPEIFVPAFEPLLPCVLRNLVANTLALRTQACHALGGFVLGLSSLPRSPLHTRVSGVVAAYLTVPSTPKKVNSPSKPTESAIVRTLRLTMSQTDPEQLAQGPVWGLSILASFVVLLNARLCTDSNVGHIVSLLLALGIRHKKSSIRALTCLAWRCLTWAYFQPPLPVDSAGESEVDDDIRDEVKRTRRAQCRVMMSVLECQSGVANIGALLGDVSSRTTDEPLRLSIEILQAMTAKSGHPCYDATQTMMQLVSSVLGEQEEREPWDHNLLLPKDLFSASSALFTTEYKNIIYAIRPLFENVPSIGDVRPLSKEEITREWVLNGLMTAWKSALGHLELCDEADMPHELVTTWAGLLKANVEHLQDNREVSSIPRFGTLVMKYLIDIVEDANLNFSPNKSLKGVGPANRKTSVPDSDDISPETICGLTNCRNSELRLRVVGRMWSTMKTIFPHEALGEAAEILLACLMRNGMSLLPKDVRSALDEAEEKVRNTWVTLSVDVLGICDVDAMRVFWGCEEGAPVKKVDGTWGWDWTNEFTNAVWRMSVDKWKDDEGDWEGAVILLGVPFTDRHAWNLTSEDYNLWEDFLAYTTSKILDHGLDSSTVLDNIALFVSAFQIPGTQSYLSTRLADLLLSHLDAQEMRIIPQGLVNLVSDTMRSDYPPDPKNKPVMRWLARSLMTLVEKCPTEFCLQILQAVQEGVGLWLGDECGAWDEAEMNYDLVPLYQLVLITIQALPEPLAAIDAVDDILGSIFRYRVPSLAAEAFTEFWKLSVAPLSVPQTRWPKGVVHALRSVGLLRNEEAMPAVAALAPALDINLSPRTPVSTSTAVLNHEGLSHILSPPRPRKVFGNFPIIPSSPVSPTVRRRRKSTSSSSAVTPRTPLSAIQLCGSPSKRRRLNSEGKENKALGKGPLVSVAERIAEILETNGNLKKRKLDLEEESNADDTPLKDSTTTLLKRLKGRMKPKMTKSNTVSRLSKIGSSSPSTNSACSNESEVERRWVVDTLTLSAVPFPSTEVEQPEYPADIPRRKREDGMFGSSSKPRPIPARDVPQQRRDHANSLDSQEVPLPKIDFTRIRRPIKRSVSTPEAMLNVVSIGKRKRLESDVDNDQDLYDLRKRRPVPALQISHLAVKRHCSNLVPARRAWSMLERQERLDSDTTLVCSSDDNPQVTPRRWLLSEMQKKTTVPYGKKSAMLDTPEEHHASDDSFSSDTAASSSASSSEEDSPTKEVVSRKLQRFGSFSQSFYPNKI